VISISPCRAHPVQRLDVAQDLLEAHSLRVELVAGEGVEHEGIVGIGAVPQTKKFALRRLRQMAAHDGHQIRGDLGVRHDFVGTGRFRAIPPREIHVRAVGDRRDAARAAASLHRLHRFPSRSIQERVIEQEERGRAPGELAGKLLAGREPDGQPGARERQLDARAERQIAGDGEEGGRSPRGVGRRIGHDLSAKAPACRRWREARYDERTRGPDST
jgi:hypothetical protein